MKKTLYKTKFGWINVISENEKLAALEFNASERTKSEKSEFNDSVIKQLNEFFEGKRKKFEIPLKFASGNEFNKNVWKELLKIEYGKSLSYQDIAKKIGKPSASRAVGNAVGKNPIPIIIPCHRVLRKNGKIGGFSLGIPLKETLLKIEGIDYY